MCQSDFVVGVSTFFEEGVGLDGTEDDINDFHGCEIDFIEESIIELSFEAE